MSESLGKRPVQSGDFEVEVLVPGAEGATNVNDASGVDAQLPVVDDEQVDQNSEKVSDNIENSAEDSDQAKQERKNGGVVVLSFELDPNRGKKAASGGETTEAQGDKQGLGEQKFGEQESGGKGSGEQPSTSGEKPLTWVEQQEAAVERRRAEKAARKEERAVQIEKRAEQREARTRKRAEERARQKQERYESSRRGKKEQARQREKAERDSWYETLKKAAEEGKTGDWMSHEEKVEAGLAEEFKGISAEEAFLRDLRGDLDDEKGPLWEVQRYEFKTPNDVRKFTKAAAEVLHYEKNTVVGTQNLEVQFKSDEYDTWENKRMALLNEQWKWVKEVLPDLPYHDEIELDKRDVQNVYLDFVEYLHVPGNEHDSFLDYLEKAVPECKIEPTEKNLRRLEFGKEDMAEDLLTPTNEMGDNYYSDDEIAAMLKLYDRALIMTKYAEAMKEKESVDAGNRRRTKGHDTEEERKGVRSAVFGGEDPDEEETEIIPFPETNEVNAGAFVAVDQPPRPNKVKRGNKEINLERLLPNEEGLVVMRELAEHCLERMRAAERFDDDEHDALVEKWKANYLTLQDNINLVSVMLANKRAEQSQTEVQEAELERRKTMKNMKGKWEHFTVDQILERYSKNYGLDKSKPIIEQLQDILMKLRHALSDANAAQDSAAQAAYLDAIHEINESLVSLGPDGTDAIQTVSQLVIA